MYKNIGNNIIISTKEIIGFFNYKTFKNANKKQDFENINQVEEEKIKSIIITENNKQVKKYISNISTQTLSKRKV